MRILTSHEIAIVCGAGSELPPLPGDGGGTGGSTRKNNNGYGNGAESGPPPGNSVNNPQLLTWNSGKKGVR